VKKHGSNVIVFNHGNDDKEMLPLTAFILRNKSGLRNWLMNQYGKLHGEGVLTFTHQLYLNFESEYKLIDYFTTDNGEYIRTF
jgi:hypothetical protein